MPAPVRARLRPTEEVTRHMEDYNDDITGVPSDLAAPEQFLDDMEAEMNEISEDIDAPEF